MLQPSSIVLHVSLRDLSTNIIRGSINVVDDIDHVNRENTSIYLTSQEQGNTDFISATIGELLLHKKQLPLGSKPIIFSPFGLGILDMELALLAYHEAIKAETGFKISNFLPESWLTRK